MFERIVAEVAGRTLDPYTAADRLLEEFAPEGTGGRA